MALAHILDATLATSSLALAHIPDATLPTSSRALAHIPMAMALGKQCLCQSEPFDSRDSSREHAVKVLRQKKKPKSPNFLFSPCGETQIHQKTRHPETASFYSWRSQKRANTSEKMMKK